MYVIQHKEYKNFYKLKIAKSMTHFVLDIKEAKKFKTKKLALKILNEFKKPQNYELVRIKNEG